MRPATRLDAWFSAWLPKRCPLCAAPVSSGFCGHCRPLLPWITAACQTCGAELPPQDVAWHAEQSEQTEQAWLAGQSARVCGACLAQPPYYDHAVIPFKYLPPVAEHIRALKYHQQLRFADALGAMICERAALTPRPDALAPVPLHPRRLRQRGYNQALEIARCMGRRLGIEVCHSSMARIKNTTPQVSLSKTARQRNVQGAFYAAASQYRHIAVVDDVVTSGSTVNAAARALRAAGAETISIWAAARA